MKKISFGFISTLLMLETLGASTINSVAKENSLIVYNSNIALVHEKRDLDIQKNDTQIVYRDVAPSINTDSVNIVLPDSIKLYSQQYRFDKLTQKKLLDANIAKNVEVRILKDRKNFKIIKAKLLANNGVSSLVKTQKGRIVSVKNSNIIFSSIPKELITKPSLVWNIKALKNIKDDIKLDYIINNISWKSDYILNLNKNRANLSGWITINNHSGKRFEHTKLYVLAGDINRARREVSPIMYKSMRAETDSVAVSHKAYEGYHLYTVPFKVDLANNEKTQIKFVFKKNIDIQRQYSVRLTNPIYLRGENKSSVTQYIKLDSLDIALPKGVVRTYSKLNRTNILLGESMIEHTPKDTPIRLNIGKNFDIKVTQTALRRDVTKRIADIDIEYRIKNSSDENKIITLFVPFIRSNSSKVITREKYVFTKGNLVTFKLKINKNSFKKFKVNYFTKR